jgi:UDP-2,3-diacylglucosamine hydrolase
MTPSAQAMPPLVALFVSDLHLDAALPLTTARFLRLLDETAPAAQAMYLLGDIFEYWAGDDDIDNDFNRRIVAALRALKQRGVDVFWIAGNRDLLVGEQFAQQAGMQRLDDPTFLTLAGQRIVLTHGDMLCTDDHAYQAFRIQVREPGWQQQFLSQPLSERKRVIEAMRQQSRDAQRDKAPEIMDVNDAAVQRLFEQSGATVMIHGHTHRPGIHRYQGGLVRHVLPDWDFDHGAARGGWLQLDEAGIITPVGAPDA